MPPAGHALWVEVGGGITFVTSGENTLKSMNCLSAFWDLCVFFVQKPHMLASAGQPSLHGYDACMVYWSKGALRRCCRQRQNKTFFLLYLFFCLVRILGNGIGVLYFGIFG